MGPAWPQGMACVVHTDRYSGPVSMDDLLHSRLVSLRSRQGENLAYVRDEVQVSADWAGPGPTTFTLGALARQSATLVANRGAVQLAQDVATDGPPTAGYDASVMLRLRAFAGYGLSLGWQGHSSLPSEWPGQGLSWGVEGQGLQLVRVMTRDIAGQVHFNAASASYATQLVSDQFNDRHHYPFQGAANPQGWGWLGQGWLRWQLDDAWAATAGVEDLGRLHWSRLAHEQARLSTDVAHTDDQGNVVYAPLVQGHNGQDTLTLLPNATWLVGADWTWQAGRTVEMQVRKITGVQPLLPYTGLSLGAAGWTTRVGWRWQEKALVLGASRGPWTLSWSGDALGSGAHARALSLSWHPSW